MSTTPRRWEVAQLAFGRPYRIHLLPEQIEPLETAMLEFCLEPRTHAEQVEMLREGTDCPPDRLGGLALTLVTRLFLSIRGRLLDSRYVQGNPLTAITTDLGRAELDRRIAKQREVCQ